MELHDIFDQITTTYGRLTPRHYSKMIHYLEVYNPRKMPPKSCSVVSKIVKKSEFLEKTLTPHNSSLTMLCASSNNEAYTPTTLMIGIKNSPPKKIWTNLKTFGQEC